jgi:hypothetical protein
LTKTAASVCRDIVDFPATGGSGFVTFVLSLVRTMT